MCINFIYLDSMIKKILKYIALLNILVIFSSHLNAQQKIQLYDKNQGCDLNKKDRIVESNGSTYIYEVKDPELWYYHLLIKRNKPAVLVIPGGYVLA